MIFNFDKTKLNDYNSPTITNWRDLKYIERLINNDAEFLFSYFDKYRVFKAGHYGTVNQAWTEPRSEKNGNAHLILSPMDKNGYAHESAGKLSRQRVRYSSYVRTNDDGLLKLGFSVTNNYDDLEKADMIIFSYKNARIFVKNTGIASLLMTAFEQQATSGFEKFTGNNPVDREKWRGVLVDLNYLIEQGYVYDIAYLYPQPKTHFTGFWYSETRGGKWSVPERTTEDSVRFRGFEIGRTRRLESYFWLVNFTTRQIVELSSLMTEQIIGERYFKKDKDFVHNRVNSLQKRITKTLANEKPGRQKVPVLTTTRGEKILLIRTKAFSYDEITEFLSIENLEWFELTNKPVLSEIQVEKLVEEVEKAPSIFKTNGLLSPCKAEQAIPGTKIVVPEITETTTANDLKYLFKKFNNPEKYVAQLLEDFKTYGKAVLLEFAKTDRGEYYPLYRRAVEEMFNIVPKASSLPDDFGFG